MISHTHTHTHTHTLKFLLHVFINYIQGVDGGPPTVLLVSLVNKDGEDIEEKLLSSIDEERVEKREEGSLTEGGGKAASNGSASPTTLTVCVTFVSTGGPVYGHDVSPGWLMPTCNSRTMPRNIL